MKIESGVIFVYFYLIMMFPIQLIYYIVAKIMEWSKVKWMEVGPYHFLNDTLLPMMQATQGIINAKGSKLDAKDLFMRNN